MLIDRAPWVVDQERERLRLHARAEHPPKRVRRKFACRASVLRDDRSGTLSCYKTRWLPIPSFPRSFFGFVSDTAATRPTIVVGTLMFYAATYLPGSELEDSDITSRAIPAPCRANLGDDTALTQMQPEWTCGRSQREPSHNNA